jgi:uncharacterized protein (DUF2249 family)
MNETLTEQLIDVRVIPPRQKHPTIFNAWLSLPADSALLIVNDHDPLPLYYQFACEFVGNFRWEYLERGPETWRVRVTKGEFPDPGFVPEKKKVTPVPPVASVQPLPPLVLDTRPIFARGETPCGAIDEAAERVLPGQPLVLLVPFEPVPLYTKLGREGFSHQAAQLDDGTWRVEFRKAW